MQYVSVYNVPDADREQKSGNRQMWSDPVKVKHWEERLDTDRHIFFRESKSPRREVVRSGAGAGVVYPPLLESFA